MKIVFLSNYFNHHQSPFCHAMYRHLGDSFVFVQTREMDEERANMGWGLEKDPPFLRKSYVDPVVQEECNQLIEDADAVIIGSAPESLVVNRIRDGKLVIRYSERIFKKTEKWWKAPYIYYRLHKKNPKGSNIYVLCASAYTSSDYGKVGLFKNRCYKWGYFPEVKRYNNIDQVIASKKPGSILWVARLIELKHPELPVLLAKRLKDEGYSFEVSLIGTGVLEEKIRNLIDDLDVGEYVKLLGGMKPWEVRKHMEYSQIFMFTSDRNEGWGAVLNEAMNSGCGVVAGNVIGAAPYLIDDGKNGVVYKSGDFEDLYLKVKTLLENPKDTAMLGKNAYETMINEWNADTAVDRLLLLLDDLQNNKDSQRYAQGPCSKA